MLMVICVKEGDRLPLKAPFLKGGLGGSPPRLPEEDPP